MSEWRGILYDKKKERQETKSEQRRRTETGLLHAEEGFLEDQNPDRWVDVYGSTTMLKTVMKTDRMVFIVCQYLCHSQPGDFPTLPRAA